MQGNLSGAIGDHCRRVEALLGDLSGLASALNTASPAGADDSGTADAVGCVMARLRASEDRLEQLIRGETRTWPRQSAST